MKSIQVYLYEVQLQCEVANRAYLELQAALAQQDNFTVFYSAHHFLVHAANVDKLLRPSSKADGIAAFPLTLGRFADGFPPARRFRNHFEHFDERLARWLRSHEGQISYDLTIHPKGEWGTGLSTVRAISGNLIRFLDDIYDLAELHSCLEGMRLEVGKRLKAFRNSSVR